ncbi:MAG: stage II sporulation protein M [Cyclobacteriaceae bacterium]
MKETRFIAQNKEKWQESEYLLVNSVKDPEKLSSLFTQVIDDLSYSRTYYPNRSVRVYLNKIAREYFFHIYSHQKARKNTFKQFWLDELPQIVYHSRKALLISLMIFFVSASIGIFSSMNDSQFASTILSEEYVAMTKANIEKGDPMAVYKEAHQVDMFLGITLNNLMVAFRTYVFGIFLSIGTVAILLYNGIMVGCFQFFFLERGLFAESALAIWLHGTLEISSIIIAGGAGLTLGSGLLFPGTYSRLQAFQITAMRSLKLMLGISPIFVLAAIIESFLTRYTEVPDVLRFILILLSAFFILGYFVYYPWMKSRKGFDQPLPEVKLPPGIEEPVYFGRIKNNAEILKDTFVFYKKSGGKLLRWIALITVAMTTGEVLSPEPRAEWNYSAGVWQSFFGDLYYALETSSSLFLAINVVGSSLIIYIVFALIDKEVKGPQGRMRWQSLLQTVVIIAMFYGMLYTLGGWGVLIAIVAYMLFLLLCFCQLTEDDNFFNALWRTWKVNFESFGQVMGLQFILLMMSFSFLLILSAPLLYMNTTILQWNFAETDVWSRGIVNFIEIFLKLFAFNLVIPVFASSAAYLYFSLKEVFTADSLKRSISAVGLKHSKNIRA